MVNVEKNDELEQPRKEINRQSIDPIEEKLYWLQIGITVIIGIAAFYIFDAGLFNVILGSDPAHPWSLRVLVIIILQIVLIVAIPFIILYIKTQKSVSGCVKTSFRNIGTNLVLIILIFAVMLMLNR